MNRRELTDAEKVIDGENIKYFIKARKQIIETVTNIKNDMISRIDPKVLEEKYKLFAKKYPKAWAFVITSGKENVEKFIEYNQEYLEIYKNTSARHDIKKFEADKAVSQKIANLHLYRGNHHPPTIENLTEADNIIKNKLQIE